MMRIKCNDKIVTVLVFYMIVGEFRFDPIEFVDHRSSIEPFAVLDGMFANEK